jgi:Ca2+-binding EF-hand superfamily protein
MQYRAFEQMIVSELSKGEEYKSVVQFGFDLLDMDRDGRIGVEDLKSAASDCGLVTSDVDEMIKEFDLDGDGYCKRIDFFFFLC